MRAELRFWVIGAGLTALAVWRLAVLDWGGAIVLFAGAAGGLLVSAATGPAAPAVEGAGAGLRQLVAALELTANGIYVPRDDRVDLFLPADAQPPRNLPPADGPVLSRDPGHGIGAVVAPPGADLLRRWLDQAGRPSGVEATRRAAQAAFEDLGLGAELRIRVDGDGVRASYRHNSHRVLCAASHVAPPWHRQGMCAVCSFLACLLAAGTARPLRITGAGLDGDKAWFDAELGPW